MKDEIRKTKIDDLDDLDDLVEICRSFSFRLNKGNYEHSDFFCSQKAEVPKDQARETSEGLYQFCKEEVMKSVNEYIEENKPKTKEQPL